MRILVGISGGVDSAFAAKKLLDEGRSVEGAVLRMHEYTEIDAAREAAESVGIRLHEIDCAEDFNIIKENFVSEYAAGRTPNPCIICNERVKFARLYKFAVDNGFDAIATGHYARVTIVGEGENRRFALGIAEDTRKDQTYMLYRLPQEILSMLVLPLSDGRKTEIRKMAEEQGISSAKREDSQEICFLPDGNYTDYIESVAGKCPEGDFIDNNGNVIGRHKGIIHYTVGQRKGLGISLGSRAFVTDIDPENNTVTLSSEAWGSREVRLNNMVYSGMTPPKETVKADLLVKLRYTAPPVKTTAELYPDGSALLRFDEPVKNAPGQSAVLYREGVVMCGGFIVK